MKRGWFGLLLLTVAGPASASPGAGAEYGLATREAPPLAELTARLQEGTSNERLDAARRLGELGEEGWPAAGVLVEVFRAKDSPVAVAALGALCRMRAPEALALVREGLTAPISRGRAPGRSIDLTPVRDALAPYLIELSVEEYYQPLALNLLGPRQGEAEAALEAALASADGGRRSVAARGLGWIGPTAKAALPRLVRAMTDADVRVRVEAAWAAWRLDRRPEAASVLASALRDPLAGDPVQAAAYLVDLGADAGPAAADLVEALGHPNNDVRSRALTALRNLGRRAVPDLLQGLRPGSADRRQLALSLLAESPEPPANAVGAVRAALEGNGDGVFQLAAVRWLAQREPPARRGDLAHLLLPALDDYRTSVEAAALLAELGPSARAVVPELLTRLHYPDPDRAAAAADALVAVAPERAEEAWTGAWPSLDPGQRWPGRSALAFLRRLGPAARRAHPALLACLAASVLDPNGGDGGDVQEVLAQTGGTASMVPFLIQTLAHPDGDVRSNAYLAVRTLGVEAIPALRAAAAGDNPDAAGLAAEALRHIRTKGKW
jgi:HEAT repeat protein